MGLRQAASAAALRRTGLLGGSFDPVHNAHLALAQAARAHLHLDMIELIPAAAPWQKHRLGASAEHRLAMLELAIADTPGLRVNRIEIDRDGPTYTLDTLRELGAGEDPAHRYVWILGSDQLVNFCTWQGWQEIVRRVDLAVAQRPGSTGSLPPPLEQELAANAREILEIPFAPTPLSATAIRQRVAAGQPLDGQTPAAVAQYIHEHGLYQA